MYEKMRKEIEEIRNGTSPVEPKDLKNEIAMLLAQEEITTGQYLELSEMMRNLDVE